MDRLHNSQLQLVSRRLNCHLELLRDLMLILITGSSTPPLYPLHSTSLPAATSISPQPSHGTLGTFLSPTSSHPRDIAYTVPRIVLHLASHLASPRLDSQHPSSGTNTAVTSGSHGQTGPLPFYSNPQRQRQTSNNSLTLFRLSRVASQRTQTSTQTQHTDPERFVHALGSTSAQSRPVTEVEPS